MDVLLSLQTNSYAHLGKITRSPLARTSQNNRAGEHPNGTQPQAMDLCMIFSGANRRRIGGWVHNSQGPQEDFDDVFSTVWGEDWRAELQIPDYYQPVENRRTRFCKTRMCHACVTRAVSCCHHAWAWCNRSSCARAYECRETEWS